MMHFGNLKQLVRSATSTKSLPLAIATVAISLGKETVRGLKSLGRKYRLHCSSLREQADIGVMTAKDLATLAWFSAYGLSRKNYTLGFMIRPRVILNKGTDFRVEGTTCPFGECGGTETLVQEDCCSDRAAFLKRFMYEVDFSIGRSILRGITVGEGYLGYGWLP